MWPLFSNMYVIPSFNWFFASQKDSNVWIPSYHEERKKMARISMFSAFAFWLLERRSEIEKDSRSWIVSSKKNFHLCWESVLRIIIYSHDECTDATNSQQGELSSPRRSPKIFRRWIIIIGRRKLLWECCSSNHSAQATTTCADDENCHDVSSNEQRQDYLLFFCRR